MKSNCETDFSLKPGPSNTSRRTSLPHVPPAHYDVLPDASGWALSPWRAHPEKRSADSPPPIPAIPAIENQQPNRIIILRRNLDEILTKLDKLQPKTHTQGSTVEELFAALNETQEAVAEFSKIVEVISVMSDMESLLEVYRWFGRIFERYNTPAHFSGASSNVDQDYFKFLGHELFVTVVAFLIREQRWVPLTTHAVPLTDALTDNCRMG
jgi:hypothetical protein